MNPSLRKCSPLIVSLAAVASGFSAIAATPSAEHMAFFESKVRPLLAKHCYECHAADSKKIKGGLLLDSKEGWTAGGDSGDVIEPGKPGASLLMETVRYTKKDLEMPPKYQLSAAEIAVLERWIEIGAPDPRTGKKITKAPGIDWEKGKKHWAFQPVAKPAVPKVKDAAWVRDDVDRFILAKIEAEGLKPAPDADRHSLIRRVTLDLTGLPPTVEEVDAFVGDKSADDKALAKVVDRLLGSPSFGERWGRHWLDVARYADSVGRTRNVPFPYAWRYRNYVIDAFNADKPFNEFLAEQVAGDLLDAKNPQDREKKIVATGMLALGTMDLNERNTEQFQLDRIDDQMDTLGRATMGLTLGCARCHDHKFDPIAQTDYYAMAGIFASTTTLSGQKNRQGGNKDYTQTSLLARLEAPKPAEADAPVEAKPAAAEIAKLNERMQQLQEENKKGDLDKARRKAIKTEGTQLRQQIAALGSGEPAVPAGNKKKNAQDEKIDPNAPLAMAAAEGKIAELALRLRGEPDLKGDVVPRAFPVILSQKSVPAPSKEGSGRREMAQWLTSREHPLTARVMANRVWAHLMGRGIVETVDNFGASGALPTHPELLDHLATRFVDGGWSVKSLIRSIVLSRTYRLGATHIAANAKADEDNRLHWRANLRRLEVEAIRDSLLIAGGTLHTERPAGSPFEGNVATDLTKANGKGGGKGDPIAQPVRSVYLPVLRSKLPGMFTVFDFAEPDQVNGHRDVTTVAPQALFLLNNQFVVDVAKRSADRILAQNLPDEKSRVHVAYVSTLCRQPTDAETERALEFVRTGQDRQAGWAALMQALYSAAEFRYIP